jgi:hypothetical protein
LLSILIPTYNYSALVLVKSLYNQCVKENLCFEILVFDDAIINNEHSIENEKINTIPFCFYKKNEKTLFRAGNRNTLAKNAKFENILFIDADAKIKHEDFIKQYLPYLNKKITIVGGTKYLKSQLNKSNSLRWNYGIVKEMKSADIRNLKPYNAFTPFNTLIPKFVFNSIQFNENLKEYGHEDTHFGWQLKAIKIPLLHIDNALIHEGLEQNIVFINKSENAIKNLIQLEKNIEYHDLIQEMELLKMANKFKFLYNNFICSLLEKKIKNYLIKDTFNKSIALFSFWKLLIYFKYKNHG